MSHDRAAPPAGSPRPGAAARVLHWIWHEFVALLPAIGYFFVAFTIIRLNARLILEDFSVEPMDLLRPLIGALIVAKILLVVNLLPWLDRFPGRPLVWNTVWKAMIYWLVGIAFQVLEAVVPQLFGGDLDHAWGELASWRFVLIQMWLVVLLLIFVAFQELVRAVGPARVRAMFFGGDGG